MPTDNKQKEKCRHDCCSIITPQEIFTISKDELDLISIIEPRNKEITPLWPAGHDLQFLFRAGTV
jgi:hypothetical protein